MFDLNSLLVPVDFSAISEVAVDRALGLVSGDDPIVILLHVLDPSLAEFANAHGLGTREEVLGRMRAQAEERLQAYKDKAGSGIRIETIVAEGLPFVEILRKARDFEVHAIVMSKFGVRGKVEEFLFGSTAERVIRAANRPVIVLPLENPAPEA